MAPGDIVVCWFEGIPKRVRRLEEVKQWPDGSTYYECGPVGSGFEGQHGVRYDHAEPWAPESQP